MKKLIFTIIFVHLLTLLPDSGWGSFTTVYTPKGTAVFAEIRNEMSDQEILDANEWVTSNYPAALLLCDASRTYNCHAYAWHISEGGTIVWINDERAYWADGSYVPVDSEDLATKVSYGATYHSAVTTTTTGYYTSKWGQFPLMYHEALECPYVDAAQLSYFVKNGDNPAACVDGFSVIGSIARWKVSSEYKSESYLVEGSEGCKGSWIRVSQTEPPGPGWHAVDVTCPGVTCFRLIEIENSGKRIIHGVARQSSKEEIVETPRQSSLSTVLRDFIKLEEVQREQTGERLRSIGDGETCIIFTPDSLSDAVELYVADYWKWIWGYNVIVHTTDGFPSSPDEFRYSLKSAIADYAAAGVFYFHLIGDANDWREFDGDLTSSLWVNSWEQIRLNYLASEYPAGGQPEKDIIPTFAIPDTLPRDRNTAYYTPYFFSDMPFADINDDSIPDVVVTRWPVNSASDVMRLALKMQNYNRGYNPEDQIFKVGFFVGDVDHDGIGDGTYARDVACNVEAVLPSAQEIVHLYESECIIDADRNIAAVDLWNNERPELLVIISSYSNRSWPGNFFDQTLLSGSFHMGMIEDDNGHTPLMIAGSCGGSDYARTEDPDFGTPIAEKFLFAEAKGSIAWVGPTAGSWQEGNSIIVQYIIEEIYSDLSRPMAASWLAAMQRICNDCQNQRDILQTAKAYMFLGDPLSRLSHVLDTITDANRESEHLYKLALEQNIPNPFNPSTSISFTLPKADLVSIKVYDVTGKLVKALVDNKLPAGRHVVNWKGYNDAGGTVASGIYFCRMNTCEGSKTIKMVIIR